MTEEKYKEMLGDIINNGAEYEYRSPSGFTEDNGFTKNGEYYKKVVVAWSNWKDFSITDGFNERYDYRKKVNKTWLEENVGDNAPRLEAIKDFCKELMRRVYDKGKEIDDGDDNPFSPDYIWLSDLEDTLKEMGVQ